MAQKDDNYDDDWESASGDSELEEMRFADLSAFEQKKKPCDAKDYRMSSAYLRGLSAGREFVRAYGSADQLGITEPECPYPTGSENEELWMLGLGDGYEEGENAA